MLTLVARKFQELEPECTKIKDSASPSKKRKDDKDASTCSVSLATALKSVNELLADQECPIKSFNDLVTLGKSGASKNFAMTKGESLLAELLYLRVEAQALRQKNRKLKKQLFGHFLPYPKKFFNSGPGGPGAFGNNNLARFSVSHSYPVFPTPCDLPPVRVKGGVLKPTILPPVTSILSELPRSNVISVPSSEGCKSPSPRTAQRAPNHPA